MALRNRKLGTIEALQGQILQETDAGAVVDNERVYQGGSGTKYEDISSQTYKTSIARIRAATEPLNPLVTYITMDFGVPGEWEVDESDTTSLDNTGTILVTAGGQRLKRKFKGAVNIRWFGAGTNTNNYNALKMAMLFDSVYIPNGVYDIDPVEGPISIKSGTTINFDENAILNITTVFDLFLSNGVSDITINGIKIIGTGAAGFGRAVRFQNSSNINIIGGVIDNYHGGAVQYFQCDNSTIENVTFKNNYGVAISDEGGLGNNYTGNYCIGNGFTSSEIGPGGRGIVLWKSVGCCVNYNKIIGSSEYGLRVYSQIGDITGCDGCVIDGNYFKDNVKTDLYMFNASGLLANCTGSNNIIERTVNQEAGFNAISIQGKNISFSNFKLINKTGGQLTGGFIFLGSAENCMIDGVTGDGFSSVVSYSPTSVPNNCIIKNVNVTNVAVVTPAIVGSGHKITDSTFVHGGIGTTDVGISAGGSITGVIELRNIVLDGFYRGIEIGDNPLVINGVTTINSTNQGVRKYGNVLSGFDIRNNNFDSSSPSELSGLISIYRTSFSRRLLFRNIPPSALTWDVGDMVFNTNSSNGAPVGWKCQIAGTPGTWVPFGIVGEAYYSESEITGTDIDFTVNGARFKDTLTDLVLTVSNVIAGKEVSVQITNTDVAPHTVTITGVPFPDGANNEIPAGGRAHISLQQINGVIDAAISIYSV